METVETLAAIDRTQGHEDPGGGREAQHVRRTFRMIRTIKSGLTGAPSLSVISGPMAISTAQLAGLNPAGRKTSLKSPLVDFVGLLARWSHW
jgi:hypothetical protein